MAAVTLTTLISRVRSRADMPLTGFVTDAELTTWINEGVQQVHEKLVSAYGEEYVASSSALTTVAGTTDYNLPSDFFKLYGVDLTIAGRTRTLLPYMRGERNIYKNASWTLGLPLSRYLVTGSKLRLLPAPPAATGSILYAPEATALVNGADTVNFPNGWEKWVVAYAATQALMKEESDTRELGAFLNKWDQELEQLKESRDAAFPRQTVDVDAIGLDEFGWP